MKIADLYAKLEADTDSEDEIFVEDAETGYLYDFTIMEAERPRSWILSPLMDTRMENE
jgi:hypothetical protein